MKILHMRKKPTWFGYFRYEILERGRVIASRLSRRDFITAFVVEWETDSGFKIERMFGREDLFHQAAAKASGLYAIAHLDLSSMYRNNAQLLAKMLDHDGAICIVAGKLRYLLLPGSSHYQAMKNVLSDFGCDHVAKKLQLSISGTDLVDTPNRAR